jgi:hypothetical protein
MPLLRSSARFCLMSGRQLQPAIYSIGTFYQGVSRLCDWGTDVEPTAALDAAAGANWTPLPWVGTYQICVWMGNYVLLTAFSSPRTGSIWSF